MPACPYAESQTTKTCQHALTRMHIHTHTRRMYLRVRISQYGVLSVSLRDEGMQMNAFVFRVPANSLACLNGHHALNLKPP